MKKFLVTVAILTSFLIFCFGWLSAGGPEDGHTWDERANGIDQPNTAINKSTPGVVIMTEQWSVIIWRTNAPSTLNREAKSRGKLSYIIIER